MTRSEIIVGMVVLGACARDRREPAPAEPPSAAAADATVAGATVAGATVADATPAPEPNPNRITFTVKEQPAGPVLAARCRLAGDPLEVDCVRGASIAVDGKGRLYATDKTTVRRYVVRAVGAEACELDLDATFGTGGMLPQPDLAPAPQRLDGGPVYMSSGGPDWNVVAGAGSTMYLVEYLRGVHRVDRGKVEPVCPALQGVRSIAVRRKDTYVDGDKVALGGKCARVKPPLEPRASALVAVGDDLWGEIPGFDVVRYDADGEAAVTLGTGDAFEPGGICAVSGLAPCGDGICVVDGNCMRVTRYARDGAVVAVHDDDALFATRPYAIGGAAAAADGALWFGATHKDADRCEGAVYRVAAP